MSAHYLPALLPVCPAKFVPFLCLYLVLEELKWPHYPESGRGHEACREELPMLRVHQLGVTSTQIQHADKACE